MLKASCISVQRVTSTSFLVAPSLKQLFRSQKSSRISNFLLKMRRKYKLFSGRINNLRRHFGAYLRTILCRYYNTILVRSILRRYGTVFERR